MIDPGHSLAFSIEANRGVYAVLVGSGVSRAAKIPTGWEVTLDLIRKLAKLCGETCDPAETPTETVLFCCLTKLCIIPPSMAVKKKTARRRPSSATPG